MKKPLLGVLLVIAAARPAWPCPGVSDTRPRAGLVGYEDPGLQPWITLRNADPVNVTLVAAAENAQCSRVKRCEGTVVPHDVIENYIRPARPLPEGTRLQVVYGRQVIGHFTTRASKHSLGEWEGVALSEVHYDPIEGVTTVTAAARQTDAMSDSLLFVYWSAPDPRNLLKNIAEVHPGSDVLDLRSYKRPTLGIPVQLWVVAADANGHLTAPQKLL